MMFSSLALLVIQKIEEGGIESPYDRRHAPNNNTTSSRTQHFLPKALKCQDCNERSENPDALVGL